MKIARILRHAVHSRRKAARTFTPDDLVEIAGAVAFAKHERQGQIRVVVENAMSPKRLARGTAPARRAMEIFAKHHLWDTELNDGILVFILMADRHVAVLADRGIDRKVPPGTWKDAVKVMEKAFREGDFNAGVMDGIAFIAERLPRRDPARPSHADLPVAPLIV